MLEGRLSKGLRRREKLPNWGEVLPTGLANTGNHTLIRKLAETDTAYSKLSINRPRPTTEFATVLAPYGELRRAISFCDFTFACHGAGFRVNPIGN